MDRSWITFILKEDDFQKAHRLYQSILYSKSHFPFYVLVPSSLPTDLLSLLHSNFPSVIEFSFPQAFDKFGPEIFAILYCWNLPSLGSLVFLYPDSMVFQNCDCLLIKSKGTIINLCKNEPDFKFMKIIPNHKVYLNIRKDITSFLEGGFSINEGFLKAIEKNVDVNYVSLLFDLNLNNIGHLIWDAHLIRNEYLLEDFDENLLQNIQKEAVKNLREFISEVKKIDTNIKTKINENKINEPIAIVGVSCRLPMSNNLGEFWTNILTGKDCIQKVPINRWTEEQSCNQSARNNSLEAGFVNCPVEELDGLFFGINPSESVYTDPQQRLLMQVAWEAFEDAGIPIDRLRGTDSSIHVGMWTQDYKSLMTESEFKQDDFLRTYIGNGFSACSARLARLFGTTGDTSTSESACASSIVAVGNAIRNLRNRNSDTSLVCGVNLTLKPFCHDEFSMVCSSDSRCKSFDKDANGYARSEGAVAIVLKRLSDAISKDTIYGIISGYGQFQDSLSQRFGRPSICGEKTAMIKALADGNVDPLDVSFIEAHGTGTQVGDSLELKAINEVYCSKRESALLVGSVKSNIGHTESCSGLASLVKVLLVLKHEIIPQNIHFKQLTDFEIVGSNIQIPTTSVKYSKDEKKVRIVGISNYGITGTNTHLIIEDVPYSINNKGKHGLQILPNYVLTISAKNDKSLNILKSQYVTYLQDSNIKIQNVVYAAAMNRQHFPLRVAVLGKSTTELASNLKKDKLCSYESVSSKHKNICFLFPGHGCQIKDMGKIFFENVPIFRKVVFDCDSYLQSRFNLSLIEILWGNNDSLLVYTQCGLLVVQFAFSEFFKSCGILPSFVFGHSLGEYAAACVAGVMSINDALFLIISRSELVAKTKKGNMIAVNRDINKVFNILKTLKQSNFEFELDIAAENSNSQTIVAGNQHFVNIFENFCNENGIISTSFEKNYAFHSNLMDKILNEFAEKVKLIDFKPAKLQFISSTYSKYISNFNSQYWVDHTRNMVKFKTACDLLPKENLIFIEIGPKMVLTNLIKQNLPETFPENMFFESLGSKISQQWDSTLLTLANLYTQGNNIKWDPLYEHLKREKIKLPEYPWDSKKFWFKSPKKHSSDMYEVNEITDIKKNTKDYKIYDKSLENVESIINLNEISTSITEIDLKTQEYLNDHKVGTKIVLPAAEYMDTIFSLILGIDNISTDSFRTYILKQLTFKNALEVSPYKPVKIFTKLTKLKSNDCYDIELNTFKKNGDKLCHCTTKSKVELLEKSLVIKDKMDVKNWQKVEPACFYENARKTGIQFGPTFRSLDSIYISGQQVFTTLKNPISKGNVVHPIILDALLQSAFIAEFSINPISLVLPVYIRKVIKRIRVLGENLSIYSYVSNKKGLTSKLFNFENELIIKFEGIDFARTTLSNANTILEESQNEIPLWYEEKWSVDPLFEELIFPNFMKDFENIASNNQTDNILVLQLEHENLNKAVGIQIMKHLRKLIGTNENSFVFPDALSQYENYFAYIKPISNLIGILKKDGFLKVENNNENDYFVWATIYDDIQIEDDLELIISNIKLLSCEYRFALIYIQNIANFLNGLNTPLEIMFPTDKNTEFSAFNFYTESHTCKIMYDCLKFTFNIVLSKILQTFGSVFHINIIEIGAGTGSGTKYIVDILDTLKICYTYTFTDITSAFFVEANTLFSKTNNNRKFRTLNIEKDPRSQGFEPLSYDIVIAGNVIHATSDVKNSISNICRLLKPSGILFLLETFEPQKYIDATFGLLPGYWNFKDNDTRSNHCLLSVSSWKSILLSSGFDWIESVLTPIGGTGVIVSQLRGDFQISQDINETLINSPLLCSNRSYLTGGLTMYGCKFIQTDLIKLPENILNKPLKEIVMLDSQQFCTTLQNLILQLDINKSLNVLYIWPYDDEGNEALDLSNSFLEVLKTLGAIVNRLKSFVLLTKNAFFVNKDCHEFSSSSAVAGFCRTFRSEYPTIKTINIDLDNNYSSKILTKLIVKAIYNSDCKPLLALRNGICYCANLCQIYSNNVEQIDIPNVLSYELLLPISKKIEDIQFTSCSELQCRRHEVKVEIEAYGMNFKDVLNIIKPSKEFDNMTTVCAEYSGCITEIGSMVKNRYIGQRVFGCQLLPKPMTNQIVIDSQETIEIPSYMSFEEAATITVAFSTAYTALYMCGTISPAQTLLIHSAAGGLGLMCVQLAKRLNLNIIATAGTETKRNYLKRLGVDHVFDSRSLEFVDQILNVTSRKGVDIVINTMTGKGFINATINCCGHGAKFIEVSKLNIWTKSEFDSVRPDLDVHYIDLSIPDTRIWYPLFKHLERGINNGWIEPLPYTRFLLVDIKSALKFIFLGTHIGKIIVVSSPRNQITKIIGPSKLFSSNKTYIVTGGTSGIGLEVAILLSRCGAKSLILCARSSISDSNLIIVNRLKEDGTAVRVEKLDVGNLNSCIGLLKTIKNIGGIFHCAGLLSDQLLSKMKYSDIQKVYNAKVYGALNLHNLTYQMNLEYFVLFSSLASIFGAIGQGNHAAANAFLDQLARYRQSQGYKALSINWGQWGETGSATSTFIKDLIPMKTGVAIAQLELALRNHFTHVSIFSGNVQAIVHRFPWASKYLKLEETLNKNCHKFVEENIFQDKTNLLETLTQVVKQKLAMLLQVDKDDILDEIDFESIGVDSLVSVEFKNSIQSSVGDKIHISSNAVIEHNSVQKFSKYLQQSLNGLAKDAIPKSSISQLIAADIKLCENISPDIHLRSSSDIKIVLLTGATGTMGLYLLKELLNVSKIDIIYCLVRCADEKIISKTKNNLIKKGVDLKLFVQKVNFIKGDIGKHMFDLDLPLYEMLAKDVDLIFNFAASVNHLEEYSNNAHCSVRNINVLGVKRLLEFAVTNKLKTLFQASSLIAVQNSPSESSMSETWPDNNEFDNGPEFGYAISKYVADLLIKSAVCKGVPCKVFRFPLVVGDTAKGEVDLNNKHFILRLVSYLNSGMVPNHWIPALALPVDVCVSLCLKLSCFSNAPSGVYNICHPNPELESDVIIKLQKNLNSKPIRVVSYSEYVIEQKRLGKSSIIWPFLDFYTNPNKYEKIIEKSEHMKNWYKKPKTYYRSAKLDTYIPDWHKIIESSSQILERNFNFILQNYPDMIWK